MIRKLGSLPDLALTFDVDPTTGTLTNGDITDGTTHAGFAAWRNKWATTMPAAELAELRSYLGRYNFGMEPAASAPLDGSVPEGIGYGSFVVASTGALTVAGKLADGTVFTNATFCGPNGEVLIFQLLYGKLGSVVGSLDITPGNPGATPAYADNTLTGTTTWLRPATATRVYADGFAAVELDVVGARYIAPAKNTIVLGLAETGIDNAHLAFGPQSITTQDMPGIDFRIRTTAVVSAASVNPRHTIIAINATTGLFNGSFTLEDQDPAKPGSNAVRPSSFFGILTSSSGAQKGVGYFLLPELPAAGSSDTVLTSKILSGPVVLAP